MRTNMRFRSFDMLRTGSAQADNGLSSVTLSKFILSEVEVLKCSLNEGEGGVKV